MRGFNFFQRLGLRRPPAGAPVETLPVPQHNDATTAMTREILRTGRFELLTELDRTERTAVARQLAGRLDDPRSLYLFLWRCATNAPEYLLALASSLRGTSSGGALWPLRVVTALSEGRAGPLESADVLQALLDCLPALDSTIDEIIFRRRAPRRLLRRLFDALPPELAVSRLERLAYAGYTNTTIAWEAVDRLVKLEVEHSSFPEQMPDMPDACARWMYYDILRDMGRVQALPPAKALACLTSFAGSGAGARRVERLVEKLALHPGYPAALRLATLELLSRADHSSWAILAAASRESEPGFRRSALALLARGASREALAELVRLALHTNIAPEVRLESVIRLCAEAVWDVAPVLQRCALDETLALAARLRAAAALGLRPAWRPRLLALVRETTLQADVRAAAARAVARNGPWPPALRLLLDPQTPPTLAVALCACVSPDAALDSRVARKVMLRVLEQSASDVDVTLAALAALARLGDMELVAPLARLAGAGALERLRSVVPADALLLPARDCLARVTLPERLAERFACALATAPTVADQPATLAQFLAADAEEVRRAALEALAQCGGVAAHDALLALLPSGTAGIAAALAQALDTLADSATLLRVILNSELDSTIRWHVLGRLIARHDGALLLRNALTQESFDTYGYELAIDALAEHAPEASAQALMQLAGDVELPEALRERALAALGNISSGITENMLVRMLSNSDISPTLRGMAAASLPATMSSATSSLLRDMARNERLPDELLIGMLKAFARAGDVASRALLLRYSYDEHPGVAQAAIAALARCGDQSMSPALVRLALNANADVTLKLHALEALLHLGDSDAIRLLRPYLGHGSVLARLRAFAILADVTPLDAEAEQFARDRLCPLPLRLRALAYLLERPLASATLAALVSDANEDPAIRIAAAAGAASSVHASALADVALNPSSPLMVRAACIAALGRAGGVEVWLALSALASDGGEPAIRALARRALQLAEQQ